MESAPSSNVGRSDLPCELRFALAPRETDPTPVVTRSSEVSRVEPTSAMVTRSRAREGRGGNVVPEVLRPETETRQEVNKPAEIQDSMLGICEEGLGATTPHVSDIASQHVTADKPETTAAFTSLENNPNFHPLTLNLPSSH